MLLRYHYRNALYFNLKNGPWHIKLLVWPWSWLIITKQIIKIVVGKNKEQSLAILKGWGIGTPAKWENYMIKRIGIECRSIEDKNPDLPAGRQVWGVGRIIMKLLEELSRRPELEKNFRFIFVF